MSIHTSAACLRNSALCVLLLAFTGLALAEGSRSLYPAAYPAAGARADLDLQANTRYMDRVIRRGFIYVYAEAGEYILLGSSNTGSDAGYGGDINVYNPQDFGIPGDETIPGSPDFTCTGGSVAAPGPHFSGPDLGRIRTRAAELAGPNSADGGNTVAGGYDPCAYRAPAAGVYGILFTPAGSGGGPDGRVDQTPPSTQGTAAWDVTVRSSSSSLADIDGRVFTYAFIGFTGGNNRPVFSTLYYVTEDGYRYRQDLRGLDPNGYALYANTFGFLDDNEPLYKTLRSNSFAVANLPAGVSAQAAEYPIFFSDIGPGGAAEPGMESVLDALDIPTTPPSPQISQVAFSGELGGSITSTGVGGTFSFLTTDTVSYEIVISRDGVDFDAANPLNRVLTGIAYSGQHAVVWDGLGNDLNPFPASATPYRYRAYGRNGEVHFPIIDAENNGIPGDPDIPGGGPTITRLNGTDPGDTTVFFDDRGYVTRSGEAIGNLNGTLCPGATPAAADPPVSLSGVDSTTLYRLWQNGRNRNSDCAADAGWGDAKGVNLWTYFLTPEVTAELEVREFPVDVGTSVSLVDTAEPGETVQGTFSFANYGTQPTDVSYSLVLSPGLSGVNFANLPGPASYDPVSGVVTLSGFAPTLAAGQIYSNLLFRYTAPASGAVTAATSITATSAVDQFPANNTARASTGVGDVDVATQITGVPATADPGSTVQGSVLFSNVGTEDAFGMVYGFSIGEAGNTPGNVEFTSLPNGVTAIYDDSSGLVTLAGMPPVLVEGQVVSLSFSYSAPTVEGASIPVSSVVSTTSSDAVPSNNAAATSTLFEFPPGAEIRIAARAVCVQNAPYVEYDLTAVNFTPNTLATVEFIDAENSVIQTLSDQPLTGARILWPDAAVDLEGNGTAWPGWTMSGGDWVEAPSLVRPELTVRISVNPSASVTLSYPGATADCDPNPPSTGNPGPGNGQSGPVSIPVMPAPAMLVLVLLLAWAGRRARY